jgi:radical SAM protein with 4Fe4S-binding SPASM domain
MTWITYLVAAAILILAAVLVYRGVRSFIKTGGQSACKSCPYSGSCGGHCDKKPDGE